MTAVMEVDREPNERHFNRSSSRADRADSVDSVDSASTSASTHSSAADDDRVGAGKTRDRVAATQQPPEGPCRPAQASQASSQNGGAARAHLVAALASVLGQMASLGHRPQMTFSFHASRIPALSVHDYLSRLAAYYGCSDQCLVLALVYIDRIVKKHPEFVVSPWSIHRLLMTSLMVAAKFWDDIYFLNSHYAKVGGVRLPEMNRLEMDFLKLIGWRLQVLPQQYAMYQNQVLLAAQGMFTAEVQVPRLTPSPSQADAQGETEIEAADGSAD